MAEEQREKRLAKMRSYKKQQRECMRALRKNESSEQREKRLAIIRSYKKQVVKGTNDESVEERNSRLEREKLIGNFHSSISSGPLYVSSSSINFI